MKVTVCELRNNMDFFEDEWQGLVSHVKSEGSDLVLLPEMPFHVWIAHNNKVNAQTWQASIAQHDYWIARLTELEPAMILSSRPVIRGGKRLNEAFVWDEITGYQAAHHKYYLPDEKGWWEASWYEPGEKDFAAIQAGPARLGFLLCTELWFSIHAREYAKQDVDIIACPRATGASIDKWIAGGTAAAVVSGAYCLSSNFSSRAGDGFEWGGTGWIIEPKEGAVLGATSSKQPFLTLDIDLAKAKAAKQTYPRYVLG